MLLYGQPQYPAQNLTGKEEEHSSDQADAPLLHGKGLCCKNLLQQWNFGNQNQDEQNPAIGKEQFRIGKGFGPEYGFRWVA